jgi:hypothetical protein
MKIHEFIKHLAPSEMGKRLIILSGQYLPYYDGTLSENSVRELGRLRLLERPVVMIKTGQTYIKILAETAGKG